MLFLLSVCRFFRVVTILAIIGLSMIGRAQLTTPHFKRLGQEEGLSQGTVRKIVQDGKGFIWIATISGLNRYDGYQFRTYKQDDEIPNSLMHNSIRALLCDRAGRLWVGHPTGLELMNSEDDGFKHYLHDPANMDSLSIGVVNVLAEGKDGHIWAGHIPLSVSRLNPETNQIKRYACTYLEGVPGAEDGVSTLFTDKEGIVWVGAMEGGLQYYNEANDRIEPHPHTALLKGKAISALANHYRNGLWVSTRDHGLYYFNPAEGTLIQEMETPREILSVFQEASGRLWLGTGSDGIWVREPGSDFLAHYEHDPVDRSSLSDSKVFTIFQDEGRLLWFGTNNGMSILNPLSQVFKHYRYNSGANGLSHNRIKSVFEDEEGAVWIGTYGGGLNRLSPSRREITHFVADPDNPQAIQSNNIFALYEDKQKRMWIGSYGAGLSELDRQTGVFTKYPYPRASLNSAPHKIYDIKESPEGALLLGTGAGLMQFDPSSGQFTQKADANFGPGVQTIRSFCFDKAGHLWAGTYLNGLFRKNSNGIFTNYRNQRGNPSSLISNQVACVYETEKGQIWAGVKNGLSLFHPETETFTNYTMRDGLPDQDIYGILEDEDHRLWISTNNGLSRFNPQKSTFINFDVSDGLQGPEFNSGAWFKLKTGELAFGGVNGLNIFDPTHIEPNSHVPQIQLTSFKVLSRDRPIPDPLTPIELTSKEYFLSFEFSALDFANPGKNRYAYKMEGLDKEWNESNRPIASYTNLDYGTYTFRIKGSNDDGVWNQIGQSFQLRIAPPFYRKNWFYLFVISFVFVMLFAWDWNHKRNRRKLRAMVDQRTQSLQSANRELELTNLRLEETASHLRQTQEQLLDSAHKAGMAEIAADILHNLGNGLNGLLVSANLINDYVRGQKVGFLEKACALLDQNRDLLGPFFQENAQGDQILQGLKLLTARMEKAKRLTIEEIKILNDRVSQLSSILNAQQEYVYGDKYRQVFTLEHVLEDVLRIQDGLLSELKIDVQTNLDNIPELNLPKTKVAHIMNHLIKNACEAMRHTPEPVLNISASLVGPDRLEILIKDNGMGIEQHILERIFSQGYTTKKGGIGRGLHFCANAAVEMNGQIEVASKGTGKGAEFKITLPTQL